jgi:inorganic phosphate transporter, PiT family
LFTAEVLLVIAVVIGFYKAWNIGANDVANGMGTVVGAGTLTLRQAIVLASIFEFLGAFLVGGHVTETIKGNIVPVATFENHAYDFGVGMLAVALSSAIWLNISTLMSRPISVTHSTVGGIIGFAIACQWGGMECIHWAELGKIALTWVVSPLAGGLFAYIVYKAVVRFVLRSHHPAARAMSVVPLGFASTISIIFFSATYKGLPGLTIPLPIWAVLAITAGLAVLVYITARVIVRHHLHKVPADATDRYEVVEQWFGRLQVMTACYMSFSHGANDVASAIGPLAGSMQAFSGQGLQNNAAVSPWLMAFGGAGIVLGLATMGYRVIMAVGKKITEITPTRGFSAEFATASTVLLCSKLGIPISTTFVMVGAILGVGFARSFAAIDLGVVRRIFTSWIITIPVSAVLAAVLYCGMMRLFGSTLAAP